ncbi:MAG: hypothetical protein ACE5HT_14710 [Gemmatimonadales bacterium]
MNLPPSPVMRAGACLLCAITVNACDSENSRLLSGLEVGRVLGDTNIWSLTVGIVVAGEKLVVADAWAAPYITVMDRRTGQVLTRFGNVGEGPGEIQDPAFLTLESTEPLRVWIYDSGNKRLSLFQIGESGVVTVVKEVHQRVGVAVEQVLPTAGGLVAGGSFLDGVLLIMDSTASKLIKRVGTPPVSRDVYPGPLAYILNRYQLAADPTRSKVAVAYRELSQVLLFRSDGDAIGRAAEPIEVSPRSPDSRGPPSTVHAGLAASDSFVYVTFCKDCGPAPRARQVHVFDWTGRLIEELALDQPVGVIAVSPDDSLLYGAISEPYPMIAEFVLPQSSSTDSTFTDDTGMRR